MLACYQAQTGGSTHSSPSHGAVCSMPMPIRSTSAGSTPTHTPQDCLAGLGGDVLEAFAQGESWTSAQREKQCKTSWNDISFWLKRHHDVISTRYFHWTMSSFRSSTSVVSYPFSDLFWGQHNILICDWAVTNSIKVHSKCKNSSHEMPCTVWSWKFTYTLAKYI